MKLLIAITFVLCFSSVSADTFYKCFWVALPNVTCTLFRPDPTCGTNLVTYTNKCEFSKAHCKDQSIDLLHHDACTSAELTTSTPVNGGEVVFDFMCTSLSHMNCPTGGDKVCASDGRSFVNVCEYEKARCTHRHLHVVDCTA